VSIKVAFEILSYQGMKILGNIDGNVLNLYVRKTHVGDKVMCEVSASREGGPRADVGALRIVHFKVLVFPHPWGIFFLQSPPYLAKPSTRLDLTMHFRTLWNS